MGHLGSRGLVPLSTGVRVSYAEQGDPNGPALVLLHGWVESMRAFDRLVPRLPPRVRVLAFDQRGHGDADKPAVGYSLQHFADDTVAFMDALGVGEAVLLGASSGGYVAQQTALTHPERVRGLVLVGSPRHLDPGHPIVAEVRALRDPLDPSWVATILGWFPLHHHVPTWYLDDRVRDGLRAPAHVWRLTLAGLLSARPPLDAGGLSVPALVLWGERDAILPRAEQEDLASSLGGTALVVYPGTGHLVLWEQPEQVAADTLRLLDRVLEAGLSARPPAGP